MRPRDEAIRKRGRELVALVEGQLPQEFDVPTVWDGWPAIGVGLLARMAATLKSMLELHPSELEADGSILGRSLYEHGVYFAWLAADSADRVPKWRRADITQRLKLDDDAREYGDSAMTPETRAKAEADLKTLGGRLKLRTDKLAIAADEYWTGKVPALGRAPIFSFRGLYAWLFRGYSSIVHPSELGLLRVTDLLGPGHVRIRMEHPQPERNGPYGMGTVLFGLSLLVAGKSLGWPDADAVHRIFGRYPVDDRPTTPAEPRGCLAALLDRIARS